MNKKHYLFIHCKNISCIQFSLCHTSDENFLTSNFSQTTVCLHYHWHPHDLSMAKHASLYYLFAAVQNVRNNLNDTQCPTMLVMIDMTLKSMNVL